MPFGVLNAAQTFQPFMNKVLRGLHFCYVCVDDVLPLPGLIQKITSSICVWFVNASATTAPLSTQASANWKCLSWIFWDTWGIIMAFLLEEKVEAI